MSRHPAQSASLNPVPPELLDRAAATVCRLPEGVGSAARNRAILELLLDEGETSSIIETCMAIDARLDALCRISRSPLLAAWVRAGDEKVGLEILTAAGEAPLHNTGDGYVFEEDEFFAIVLDAAVARGVA